MFRIVMNCLLFISDSYLLHPEDLSQAYGHDISYVKLGECDFCQHFTRVASSSAGAGCGE